MAPIYVTFIKFFLFPSLEKLPAPHIQIKQDVFDKTALIFECNIWIFTGSRKLWIFFLCHWYPHNALFMIQSSQTDDPPTTCDLYYLSSLVRILSLTLLFIKPCVPLAQKEVVIKRQKLNYLHMKRWTHLPAASSTSKDQAQTAGNWPLRWQLPRAQGACGHTG